MAMTSASALPLSFKNLLHPPVTATPKPKTRIRTSSMNTPRADVSVSPALFDAAKHTVDTYVKSGMVIGLGSGCACDMAIQYMGQKLRAGALEDIVGIPMTFVSATEAAMAGIPLDQYEDSSQIDFAFHEADIIEQETLIAVIGRRRLQGDDSIIQEKSILKAANKLVFIGTENQYKGSLDGSIPVVVQSLNWLDTAEEIDDLFLGDAEVWRRPSSAGRTDPLGGDFPLLTKEGYNILDVIFTSPIKSLAEVAETLDKIYGVVDHGVISKFPCTAVIASESEGGLCIVDSISTSCISVEGL